jgi:DNA-binding protein HU-beta
MRFPEDLFVLKKQRKNFAANQKRLNLPPLSLIKPTNMNKADLIDVIAEEAGITKTQANASLDSFTNAVTKSLKNGGKVTLVGFGTFLLSYREGRKGHNPQTKAQINIKEKVVARFKGGKELLATLKSSMKDLKPLLQKKKKK